MYLNYNFMGFECVIMGSINGEGYTMIFAEYNFSCTKIKDAPNMRGCPQLLQKVYFKDSMSISIKSAMKARTLQNMIILLFAVNQSIFRDTVSNRLSKFSLLGNNI